jgi:O-antigen/teichoic acid export membrane protein
MHEFRKMFSFSSANYLAGFLHASPNTIIPLVITGILGAEFTAYYYVSWMIATILFIIPTSIGTSYLAEGSATPDKRDHDFKRALKFAYFSIIPLAIIIYLLADKILLLFGHAYSDNATTFLRHLILVTPFYTFNHVFIAQRNVFKELRWVIGGNIIIVANLFTFTIFALNSWGLPAIAYGFIIGNAMFLLIGLIKTFGLKNR